jgi:methylmalonyl-CoA mutase N-terminal domain/subunit
LTHELEQRAWDYLGKIDQAGGFIKTLESGWLHQEAARGMVGLESKLNQGELKWVAYNCYQMEEEPYKAKAFRADSQVWEKAMRNLEDLRKFRDNARVQEALVELEEVCRTDQNIMPPLMKVVQTYATVGEIGEVFRKVFGVWEPPLHV